MEMSYTSNKEKNDSKMNRMTLPEIDLDEINEEKKRIFKERVEMREIHKNWCKKNYVPYPQSKFSHNSDIPFKKRLKFIDLYSEWIKKTPNKIWSAQQKKIIG